MNCQMVIVMKNIFSHSSLHFVYIHVIVVEEDRGKRRDYSSGWW